MGNGRHILLRTLRCTSASVPGAASAEGIFNGAVDNRGRGIDGAVDDTRRRGIVRAVADNRDRGIDAAGRDIGVGGRHG